MKHLIFSALLLCMAACANRSAQIRDGIYLVESVVKDSGFTSEDQPGIIVVPVHESFREHDSQSARRVAIRTCEFVPLELSEEPKIENQPDDKKKLQLSFSKIAADKLTSFTARHVMQQAALVVDGEAITVHQIRDTIHGGKMEITGSDDGYEMILVTLKTRVIPGK
jgi:hypothetical protein